MPKRTPFSAIILSALAMLVVFGGCSAVTNSEPQPATNPALDEDVKPLGLVQGEPQEQPQDEERRRKLQQERKKILMDAYMQDANRLSKAGSLDKAEALLLEALKTDPTHAGARTLLKQVQERLGKRGGTVGSLAERETKKRIIRAEQARVKMLASLKEGSGAMNSGDFADAVRAYERAVNIATWHPLIGEKEPNLKDQALKGLSSAREAARVQEKSMREKAARDAYQQLQQAEEVETERTRARLKAILDKAQLRFEQDRYDDAERLVGNVLEQDPVNLEARKLKESILDARHHYLDSRYIEQSKERFKRWREAIAETKIPESAVMSWPSQSYWDTITARRKVYAPVYGEKDSPAVQKIKNKLKTETIPLQFESANMKEVLDWIKNVANIPIVIDSEILEELQSAELGFPLNLEKVKVGVALSTVMDAKPEFGYTFKHDVIFVTKKEKAAGTPIPVVHDVRDLTIPVQDFTPPEIRLKKAGMDEEGESIFGAAAGEAPPPYNPEDLIELIKENVETMTWDGMEGVSIDLSSGRLLVIHTADTQNQIASFLNNLRSFSSSIVTIEARFITVRDNFLEDIGVDWRGLGGAGQKGTLAVLDDVTNGAEDMASAGLDNGGAGLPIENISNPAAGAFFNDGEDGDVRGRTENIFDRVLGNMLSSVGGLSMTFAYLDDTEVNVVLRAVEKTERATILTAPRLTVYNTQRSNITVVNQISYIKDYDVEVAQTASIADPVVGIIQDGFVLDVRPTISNDRRFVTLELRPTVADLIEPIRTLTTTLGSQTQPVTIQLPELIVQSAETTVTVPDNGTVVIGGLKNILSIDRRSEVPFLADIPVLGFFFSRKGKSEEAQDLILVVTVHISDLQEQEAQLRR